MFLKTFWEKNNTPAAKKASNQRMLMKEKYKTVTEMVIQELNLLTF